MRFSRCPGRKGGLRLIPGSSGLIAPINTARICMGVFVLPGVALVGVVNPRAMASTLSICFEFAVSNG